ncbi:MAG: lipoyl(octanoyl) transferase LipB [Candidatus Omnitrophota bacterium]|jgi:lipoate-protein ligase B
MSFKLFDLGVVDYQQAREFQKSVFQDVACGRLPAAVILCQHPAVITVGRSGKKENILADPEALKRRGIDIYDVERGGDVTYHGPGQQLVYPIINLAQGKKDIRYYLRSLEEVGLALLGAFGVTGLRKEGASGVWVGNQKIASLGIAIKQWITYHGLAINIKNNDLSNFSFIRPCGMDITMTSLEGVLQREVSMLQVKQTLTEDLLRRRLAL